MKKSHILFAASCLLAVFSTAKLSEARVCFIVGGCPTEDLHVTSDCTSMGYELCNGEGLVGEGKTCIMGGVKYYEYCSCNKSLYKYSESQLKDTSYEGVSPMKCGEDGKIEIRYMDRRCKSDYIYVASIPSSYSSLTHNPVELCPFEHSVDPEFGSCEEKYGTKKPFERYKKCSHCPLSYKTCTEETVTPADTAISCRIDGVTVYSACQCAKGYGTGCAGKAVTAGGLTCYKCDVGGTKGGGEEEPGTVAIGQYKLYFPRSASESSAIDMAKKWNTEITPFVSKQVINETEVWSENTESKILALMKSGEYKDFKLVKIYPLVSNNETEWRTRLAVKSYTDDSVWLDRGVTAKKDNIDFPIVIIADLYTGRNYEEYCTDSKYKTPPISFKYAGWLSGLDTVETELMERTKDDITKISDPYYSIKEANPHSFNRVYSLALNDAKGCHPAMLKQGQRLGIEYENYSNWAKAVEDGDTNATGGDKCLNYVLGLNADIKMPAAVGDLENKILYIIEELPRARVRNVNWSEENSDYPANFLLWTPAGSGDNYKNNVCTYTKAEQNGFHQEYLQTYPHFNKAWSRYTGVISFDEFVGNPSDFAEDSALWDTYLGGDTDEMIEQRGKGVSAYSIFMNNYYQENIDKVMNGKYIWSYPWSKGGIE